ncbi:hypothetical protein ST47_g6621 [Ascochyta rabiei]|uniref:Uncharacterized protein n=2 Tax=Didymella rabiei TaxID=5454 RepID=A0A163C6U3_DIDRA|nr:hypothetical protein ST47_g6621 [Ascochyta rabiei]
MVTTRRGTETPGMAATPASSAKKTVGKRELDALDTPTQVKRQRKTTVELKRSLRSTPRKSSAESAHESVDETASDAREATPKPEKASPLAICRRSSPMVVVEPSSPAKEDAPTQESAAFHTPEPASSEAAFVTPFTSKKALEGSPTPKAKKTATPASAKKARARPKKAHKQETPEEIPSSTRESSIEPSAVAPATAHVRFGSEEPTMNTKGHTRYEAPAPAQDDDEDSADDSDEAPEMVSTAAATSKAAAAQADTSRALAAQQEKERKKREAREQRIAEEQAAKRARDALKAQKAASKAAKAARLSSIVETPEDGPPALALDRTALPSLLPDSLLAHLGDVRPPTPPPEARGRTDEQLRREKLNHHIKFLEQSSKAPRDRRVGKHHVAVLAGQNPVLPPKVSRATRGVREAWLKGRQGQAAKGKPRIGKTARTKFGGGGFLRGED